jgi:DNA-binding LacI/PurR family transcriptional regulator
MSNADRGCTHLEELLTSAQFSIHHRFTKIDIPGRWRYRLNPRFDRVSGSSNGPARASGLDASGDPPQAKVWIMKHSANLTKAKPRASAREYLPHGKADTEFLYRQVAQSIGQRIRRGELKSGARLASIDDLAEGYGVTKITIRRAFLELKSEGLIYTRPAQGTYVSELSLPDIRPRKNKVLTVGLVSKVLLPENPGPYHFEILANLRAEIGNRRGNLVVLPSPDASHSMSGQLRRSNLDAVVYVGAFDSEALRSMVRNGPPAVLVDFHVRRLKVDQIIVDNVGGGEIAMEHLLSLGHRDIAVVSGADEAVATKERLTGVGQALERAGVPLSSVRILPGNFLLESGYKAMSSLLKTDPVPTAVFCMNDEMAVGAIQAIHRLSSLEVPRDISILGFDDIIWAAGTHQRLTTIRVDKKLMGKLAMERVMSILEGPGHTITSTTINPEFLERESTAPPRKQ